MEQFNIQMELSKSQFLFQIDELTQQNFSLNEELKTLENNNLESKENEERLRKELDDLKEEIKNQLESFQSQRESLEQSISLLQQSNEESKSTLQQTLSELNEEKEKLKNEGEKRKESEMEYQKKIESLDESIQTLQKSNDCLKKKAEGFFETQQENERTFRQKTDIFNRNLNNARLKHEAEKKEMEEKVSKALEELESSKSQNIELVQRHSAEVKELQWKLGTVLYENIVMENSLKRVEALKEEFASQSEIHSRFEESLLGLVSSISSTLDSTPLDD
eukprot:TRINITY_DN7836_c0_g3_i1.p1 TRINITY_DN7836_c0_g3~~TRINITY_DN7836_c0_g3_i1.p1  ORF type:complete len:278 (-),score=132.77 TRINITY_DN7836_c0_g3_i1:640-1473(-)